MIDLPREGDGRYERCLSDACDRLQAAPGRECGASSGRVKRGLRLGGVRPLSGPTLSRLVDLCWLVPAHSRTCPASSGGLFVNQRNLICCGRLNKRQRPPLPVEAPKPRSGPPLPASGGGPTESCGPGNLVSEIHHCWSVTGPSRWRCYTLLQALYRVWARLKPDMDSQRSDPETTEPFLHLEM